jgi:ubiquinone/menaquinone biosynthesis C-methylase UbiE
MVLTPSQAQTFYDHFGKRQDTQAFYEDAALDELIAHAAFKEAHSAFEFGCGTGRFADRLLARHLPPTATYLGIDISQTMVGIAQQRLAPYGERALVVQSDASLHFPLPDHCVDRVVSTYVFDLLAETDIQQAIAEAHRVLKPGGKICLASLTQGVDLSSRLVCAVWSAIFRMRASLVGGCRPIQLASFFPQQTWALEYRHVLSQFGVPSEIVIASPKSPHALG